MVLTYMKTTNFYAWQLIPLEHARSKCKELFFTLNSLFLPMRQRFYIKHCYVVYDF